MKKIIIGMLLATVASFSWDGVASGTVGQMSVTGNNNYDLRIKINGDSNICNGKNWAYINHSDSNYNAFTSVLLTAKTTKQSVTIFVNKNASGYCHIGYLVAN